MREEWLLMEKIADLLFKGDGIPENKEADFYLMQECLKILEQTEEHHGFRLTDRQTMFCLLYPFMNYNALRSYVVAYQTTYKNANRNAYKVPKSRKVKPVLKKISEFTIHCRVYGFQKTKEVYDL